MQCLVCQNLLWVLKVKGSTVELLEIMLEETTYEAAVIAEVSKLIIDTLG